MISLVLLSPLPSFAANRTAGASADLAITLAAAPDPVTAGAWLTYTAVLTNLGPDAVPEVYIAMPVPAGTTLVSAVLDGSPAACHLEGAGVECASSFANGATTTAAPRTATIVVAVASGATGSLTATATAAPVVLFVPPPPPPDPDLSNNTATVSTTVGTHASASVPSLNRFALVLIVLLLGLAGLVAVRPPK